MDRLNGKALSMRIKILLSCIGCMLFALILQTFLFQRSSSQIIYGQAQEISSATMNNLQNDLYSFNKSVENSLIKIYNQKQFIRDLSLGTSAEELKELHGQISYDLAHSAFDPSQNLTALYIYTAERKLVSSYRHAQTPKYSYPEDIYDGSMENNHENVNSYVYGENHIMLITSYYNSSRQTNLIRYVLKIYRGTSDFVGYIVCDVDPKPFIKLMEKYRYSNGQIIWLQPRGDRVALFSSMINDEQYPIFATISEQIAKSSEDGGISGIYSGYELFRAEEHKYNFTVYSLMPQTVLQLNQTVLRSNMLLLFVLILIIFSLLFMIISNSLTKPLTYVVKTMSRIKGGETGLRLKPMRKDEIGILGQEFNDMLDETERLLKERYEARLLADDARYKALQAQVNPHFLYNTLDTMSSIAASQDCPTVSMLCRALSNVFRYSLNMEEPLSTLESEIVHIKNYMYVMNVRMNNSIRMDISVDSGLLREKVPRLSIQPLVENAINHGLKNKRGDKEIRIGAETEDGVLLVWVEDNGIGMNAAEINKNLIRSVDDALQKSSSIGVDNINARAKLLYGDAFGVNAESEPGKGSRVTLRIPFARGEAASNE